MTTHWKPEPIWQGRTVAVLASGPSLTQALADSVRHLPRVCARRAAERAPDADFCVAVDAPPNEGFWPWCLAQFAGVKVTAVDTPLLPPEVRFWWHRWERIRIGPHHEIEIRNNGMSAMHLADELGPPAKMLLVGFDPERNGHFYDNVTEPGYPMQNGEWYFGLAKGIEQLSAKLHAKGIEVVRVNTVEEARLHAPGGTVQPPPSAVDETIVTEPDIASGSGWPEETETRAGRKRKRAE